MPVFVNGVTAGAGEELLEELGPLPESPEELPLESYNGRPFVDGEQVRTLVTSQAHILAARSRTFSASEEVRIYLLHVGLHPQLRASRASLRACARDCHRPPSRVHIPAAVDGCSVRKWRPG